MRERQFTPREPATSPPCSTFRLTALYVSMGSMASPGLVAWRERHLMRGLGSAMSPATLMGIVGEWPGFREMGISIDGCEVRKVCPKKHGGLEVEYRFDLVSSGHAHLATPNFVGYPAPGTRFKATALGEYYEDDQGEKEYVKLLERLNGRAHLFADAKLRGFTLLFADLSLKGFALYDAEHRLLLHSPIADTRMRGLQVA